MKDSEINRIIPPEIKNDEFYYELKKIAREKDIKTILEIGSSSGTGSTAAFVTGILENKNQPNLYCIEVSKPRFAELQNRYEQNNFVKCYNISSVSIADFPTEIEVAEFYYRNQNNFGICPLEVILGWLRQDIEYLTNSGIEDHGIRKIKQENNIDNFDIVLIDGSEFTGIAELEEVYGAKYICLDDVNTFKNYQNRQRLDRDSNYTLIAQNLKLRNGYAIFKKTSEIQSIDKIIESGVEYFPRVIDNKVDRTITQPEELSQIQIGSPKILIDGILFQFEKTGMIRIWKSLLEEWAKNGFAQYLIILDRGGNVPKISGVKYRFVPSYDYTTIERDREMLQQVCDQECADLFISTYYTTPIKTQSVCITYDLIPEIMGADLKAPKEQAKHDAISYASTYISISENTAHDLVRVFSGISLESIQVAHCGISSKFYPANQAEISSFKNKYGIAKPYFILVDRDEDYQNNILFFKAFSQLWTKEGFEIVWIGTKSRLKSEFRSYTAGSAIHLLELNEEELRLVYTGAVALVYPSKYDGFALPVLEAIACGCPVITCANTAIPEVAGQAVLYVNDADVNGLTNALCEVQKPDIRNLLIVAGLTQAQKFSLAKMAQTIASALINATLLYLKLREVNLIIFLDWCQPEESLELDLKTLFRAIASYPDQDRLTLLIDTSNINEADADLILSSIAMNLLMEEELDVTTGIEISLIGKLSQIQWKALIPQIKARIVGENENSSAIADVGAEIIPTCELNSIMNIF